MFPFSSPSVAVRSLPLGLYLCVTLLSFIWELETSNWQLLLSFAFPRQSPVQPPKWRHSPKRQFAPPFPPHGRHCSASFSHSRRSQRAIILHSAAFPVLPAARCGGSCVYKFLLRHTTA